MLLGAGSGKTAVLVERIINKVVNEGVAIDRLLVVTFTRAAAQEMKERLADRLYIEAQNNPILNEQINNLSKASITTIDGFCNRVVQDNFFKLGIDPNYRIGDNSELELLKSDALEELFEEKYENDEEFVDLFNIYSSNKDDDKLKDIILKIYDFTRSCINPKEWILSQIDKFNCDDINDFSYANYVLEYAREKVKDSIDELQLLLNDIQDSDLAGKYVDVISNDIENLKFLLSRTTSYDEFYSAIGNFEFERANGVKNVPEDIKNTISAVRDSVKSIINKELKAKYFVCNSTEILNDNKHVGSILNNICSIVFDFEEAFNKKKKERNILDFSDISHFANFLLNNDEEVKKYYKDKFDEVLIDEYQDSNLIQESLLTAISSNRMFMVGDVKQSIYRFRQARPELFLDKYTRYNGELNGDNVKVLLFKNFRSNRNIIEQVNYIFEKIMTKDNGEIDYNEDEFLKFGADYYDNNGEKAELALIETKPSEDIELDESFLLDSNSNLEGRYIAKRIKEIVGNMKVYDKQINGYRNAKYKDIVILLRSTVNRIDGILEELSNNSIPVFSDVGGDYFNNTEVQTILSLLRIIDNPIQDIPLVSVMRSQIGGFSIDEITSIRLIDRKCSYYEALVKYQNVEDELSNKIKLFLSKLYRWIEKSKYMNLWELLWLLYNETGYFYYVSLFPDGIKRQANLKLLLERAERFEKTSFRGLFNFLSFIDKVKSSSSDFGESKVIGENEDVVRIMSIHKSKGLEFPIVFLAGVDKAFNTRDLSNDIVFDQDLGFGMEVIDYDSRIKYANISKHAISIKSKKESIAEEMRILYVAMTRAREKLIVTGLVNDIDKAVIKYSEPISKYKISSSNSFLDWIGYCVIDKISNWTLNKIYFDSNVINDNSFVRTEESSTNETLDLNIYNLVQNMMSWKYYNFDATKLPNKVSISELKTKSYSTEELDNQVNLFTGQNCATIKSYPDFIDDKSSTGAEFGTLIHSILQKVDFKNFESSVENLISSETSEELLKKKAKDVLSSFSESDLFSEIINAKKVYREMSFNLNIPANQVYDVNTNENIMVQGIIDLYFIDKQGDLILVDYKTDFVTDESELVNRYKTQLVLYRKALEDILNQKVSKCIIYSLRLNKEITIE